MSGFLVVGILIVVAVLLLGAALLLSLDRAASAPTVTLEVVFGTAGTGPVALVMNHWLPRLLGRSGLALGCLVLFRDGLTPNPARRYAVVADWMVAHELAHVAQWRMLGTVRYFGRYVLEFLRHPFDWALRPMEKEANWRQSSILTGSVPECRVPGGFGQFYHDPHPPVYPV